VRLIIWHGYLLSGTGSNVYTRSLAHAWSRMGHEVTVLCQEPEPSAYELGGARVLRPDVGRTLPVFVLDRYPDMEARLLSDLTQAERERFVDANAAAVREQGPADLLLTNHVLLGGPVGAQSGVPFVVKAHGSELEFSMRGHAELCRWARRSVRGARAILAGSKHTRSVIAEVLGPGLHMDLVRVISPGVDTEFFRPASRDEALSGLLRDANADPPNPSTQHDERRPDDGNASRQDAFLRDERATVVYVGKLSREKGVHLLIDALRRLDARAVIVGFGPARGDLERQARGLDLLFTGPLEHRHLRYLWALADVAVTPSVFPEAFGMVAAEAAACGAPPLVARHSGLQEIAEAIEASYPRQTQGLASFRGGDTQDLVGKLQGILRLTSDERTGLGRAARAVVVERWGWNAVALRVLDVSGS
jgi:glycosyltransferase involved in cell wall biosynthesis